MTQGSEGCFRVISRTYARSNPSCRHPPILWLTPRLFGYLTGGQPQLVVEGERGRNYAVEQSTDFSNWSAWTNVTANDATLTFSPGAISDKPRFYRAACMP